MTEDKFFETCWNLIVAGVLIFVALGMGWIITQALIRFAVTLI